VEVNRLVHLNYNHRSKEDLLEHFAVELLLQVAQVLANDLFTQTLARDQELGHRSWSVVYKPLLYQVFDTLLRLPANKKT